MRFVQALSVLLVIISAAGGFYVLMDPGFSAEIKGSVVTLMLIGGFTAVVQFWLGSSSGSQKKDDLLVNKSKDMT